MTFSIQRACAESISPKWGVEGGEMTHLLVKNNVPIPTFACTIEKTVAPVHFGRISYRVGVMWCLFEWLHWGPWDPDRASTSHLQWMDHRWDAGILWYGILLEIFQCHRNNQGIEQSNLVYPWKEAVPLAGLGSCWLFVHQHHPRSEGVVSV